MFLSALQSIQRAAIAASGETISMSGSICIVTRDSERADRYVRAFRNTRYRHLTRWCPDRLDGVDVVLFDPETVDRSTITTSRSMTGREYWIVAMSPTIKTTVERVERAVAGRRFETTIDARFNALSSGSNDVPPVAVPERLDTTTARTLYAGI